MCVSKFRSTVFFAWHDRTRPRRRNPAFLFLSLFSLRVVCPCLSRRSALFDGHERETHDWRAGSRRFTGRETCVLSALEATEAKPTPATPTDPRDGRTWIGLALDREPSAPLSTAIAVQPTLSQAWPRD